MFASALSGVITVGAFAAVASAASSGWVYGTTHASVTYCDEATINSGRVSDGYLESNSGSACGQNCNSPAGYFGVEVLEFYKGNICGSAGPEYNDGPASSFGLGEALRGDPGTGNYYTVSDGSYWNTSALEYFGAGSAVSPSQSYTAVGPTAPFAVTSSGMTEGWVPPAVFDNPVLNRSLLPDYIAVSSSGQIVGFVQTNLILPAAGQPTTRQSTVPVYNASIS